MGKTRGILLIALGNPMYGRMAANMCASLRCGNADLPVHLVHSGISISHLDEKQKALFTSMAECPKEYYTKGEKIVYIKAKTCVYELSPFDETIFMDVDLLLFDHKPLAQLFDELKDIDFTMQNRGFTDLSKPKVDEGYNLWANVKDVKEIYGANDKFYQLASEFIYFKRTEANKKYFALVREIFDNPRIKSADFAGDMPDEFAYDIATAILKQYPHKDNFVVIYWWAMDKKLPINEIIQQYWGYSHGGASYPDYVKDQYNNMAKYYANKAGVSPQQIFPKHQWDKQRAKL